MYRESVRKFTGYVFSYKGPENTIKGGNVPSGVSDECSANDGLPNVLYRRMGLYWRSFFSLSTLWHVLLPLGLLILLNRTVVYPNDFWWHIRVGALTLQRHAIPRVDEFSFTRAGAGWINQAWLMQVVLYVLYRLGGLPLVIFVHALIVTGGYVGVFLSLRRSYGVRVATLAVATGAAAGAYNWGVRPQSISFLLFGLLVMLLHSHQTGRSWALWGSVPLFLLWGNVHGAFTFGLVALWTYVLGRTLEAWRRRVAFSSLLWELWIPAIAALFALTVTPWGPLGLFRYIRGFLSSKVTLQGNEEFMPLTIREGDGAIFALTLGVWLTALLRSGFRPSWDQGLGVVALATLSLWSRRASPWYGFVLMLALAPALVAWWHPPSRIPRGKGWLNGLILGFLFLALFISLPWWRGRLPAPWAPARLMENTPVKATAYLCHHAGDDARVYQDQAFGAYQIWACPRLKVFIDTRIELYPPALWEDYFRLAMARFDWEEIARDYGLTHLFLNPATQSDLIAGADASPHWTRAYTDAQAVIFARRKHPER